jgi:preprotein translocase SecE subunit
VARDRKRAKQRRERRGTGVAGRDRQGERRAPSEGEQPIQRADVPGALDHASADVDEFDAALVRGADGVPVTPEPGAEEQVDAQHLSEGEVESEALSEGDLVADELEEPAGSTGRRAPGGGGAGGGVTPEQASGAPIRGGNRVIGFLRASWAELQRVQWPDRRQVTQATAVVLGFVAIAGAYLGAADFVAKEIVELILG